MITKFNGLSIILCCIGEVKCLSDYIHAVAVVVNAIKFINYCLYIVHIYSDGGGKFVILTLNKPATIDCTTPQHISQVQWLNVANLNINTNPFPGLKVVAGRLNINNVTEMLHNQIFQCEGYSNNGNMRYVQHYRVIVSSELLLCVYKINVYATCRHITYCIHKGAIPDCMCITLGCGMIEMKPNTTT